MNSSCAHTSGPTLLHFGKMFFLRTCSRAHWRRAIIITKEDECLSYTEPMLLVLLALSVSGLLRQRHCKRSLLLIAGIAGIFLLSWPPIDWLLSQPLEVWYPVRPLRSAQPQAIVVLSEGVSPADSERPYALPDAGTYERCEFAAWLHNHWRPLPVLASGGPERNGGQPFSRAMRDALQRAGVPPSFIWTEERSQSTHENALYGAQVLREHGIREIALVVEAKSMMRAAASFRKQGIGVLPAPCSSREFGPWSDELLPSGKAIERNETTLHETLGLAAYWLRGWI